MNYYRYHCKVLWSFSTGKPSLQRSWQRVWKRVSGMLGSLYRIQRPLYSGVLTTEYLQSSSSLTIQQLAAISGLVINTTLSLELVSCLSSGSGKALPMVSFLTPLIQQALSTLRSLSVMREQVAVVLSQFICWPKGIFACQYHVPVQLLILTQGTVLGGSRARLKAYLFSVLASCHASNPINIGMRTRAPLFIFLICWILGRHIGFEPKSIRKYANKDTRTIGFFDFKYHNFFFES